MNTKVIAIHLPQFHEIKENNEWWGEGFTEWTNVRRGKPLYKGHYQPRVPLNDDYYDLSCLSVLEKQMKLARKAGIYGFAFYHYYFAGKKLLEKPIEQYRDNSKEPFPYCLIWANQSWSRTWYRGNMGTSVLLQQSYGLTKEWEEHFYYLLSFFKDKRYIKIDNKPVYIIYIPQDIKCRNQMFACWNKLAKENGFDGIYLIAMNTSYGKDSQSFLYDGYINFEPQNTLANDISWRSYLSELKKRERIKGKTSEFYINREYSYIYIIKEIIKKSIKEKNERCYYGLFPDSDNTPRKDEDGFVIRGCHPVLFYFALKALYTLSCKYNKEFIFINAWNEWSEGAYLEPDKKNKYGYLHSIRKVITRKK